VSFLPPEALGAPELSSSTPEAAPLLLSSQCHYCLFTTSPGKKVATFQVYWDFSKNTVFLCQEAIFCFY